MYMDGQFNWGSCLIRIYILYIVIGSGIKRYMDDPGKLVMGVSLGLTLWAFYKSVTGQPDPQPASNPPQQPNSACELSEQLLHKLRKLQLSESSRLEQHEEAAYLMFSYMLCNVVLHNRHMKTRRNGCSRRGKREWAHYLALLVQGVDECKEITVRTRKEAREALGVDGGIFKGYEQEMTVFKQQLRTSSINLIPDIRQLTFPETQQILHLQIAFLTQNTPSLIKTILQSTKTWPSEQKEQLPRLLSLIIIDEAIGQAYPDVDQMEIQCASRKYRGELGVLVDRLAGLQGQFCNKLVRQLGLSN